MHRIIKQNYFNGKVVRRLDESLDHILTYLEDKRFDHLVKSTKGKITRKKTNIYNFHNLAVKLKDKFKVEKVDGKFVVSKGKESYIVTVDQEKCSNVPCGVDYKDCDICLHRISCNCFENSIHFEMCFHCHLAVFHILCNDSPATRGDVEQEDSASHQHSVRQESPDQQPSLQTLDYEIPDHCDFSEQNSTLLQHHKDHLASKARLSVSLFAAREKLEQRLAENIRNSYDQVAISKTSDFLLRCKLLMKYQVKKQLVSPMPFSKSKALFRKHKLDHQKRQKFVSTKQKCANRKNSLKNPTFAQRKEILSRVN